MNARPEELKNPVHRLPHLELMAAGGGLRHVHGSRRRSPVLVLVHPEGCAGCSGYLADLARSHAEIEEWDGEVLVVSPDPPAEPDSTVSLADHPFTRLHDPEGRLATALRIEPPAIVVADQWGEIRLLEPAGPDHRFCAPSEIVDWMRFIAIECPECQGEAY